MARLGTLACAAWTVGLVFVGCKSEDALDAGATAGEQSAAGSGAGAGASATAGASGTNDASAVDGGGEPSRAGTRAAAGAAAGAGAGGAGGTDAEVAVDASKACKDIEQQRIAACVELEPDADGGASALPRDGITLSGEVVEIARGPATCDGIGSGFSREQGDRPWRFRVVDDDTGRSAWVAFLLPWRSALVTVGDHVSVDYAFESELFGFVIASHLDLRDQNGELLLWAGEADSLSRLLLPEELAVVDGETQCTVNDDCGDYTRTSLAVSTADGASADVAVGAIADVGDFVLLHAGNAHQLAGSGQCADRFVASTSLVAIRGSSDSLDALDRGPCGERTCDAHQYCDTSASSSCGVQELTSVCAQAQTQCEPDCPGVCGCDGKFYCNACLAQRAGVDVDPADDACKQQPCVGDGFGLDDLGGCSFGWECFGQHYQTECVYGAMGSHCTCSLDSQVIEELDVPMAGSCRSEASAARCGFPFYRREL
jgi:hypothetical protein